MKNTLVLRACAALFATSLTASAVDTVKVFILAGQSNMEGKVQSKLMNFQATDAKTKDHFKHLRKGDDWITRDDVMIKFLKQREPLRFCHLDR